MSLLNYSLSFIFFCLFLTSYLVIDILFCFHFFFLSFISHSYLFNIKILSSICSMLLNSLILHFNPSLLCIELVLHYIKNYCILSFSLAFVSVSSSYIHPDCGNQVIIFKVITFISCSFIKICFISNISKLSFSKSFFLLSNSYFFILIFFSHSLLQFFPIKSLLLHLSFSILERFMILIVKLLSYLFTTFFQFTILCFS